MKSFLRISLIMVSLMAISETSTVTRVYEEYDEPYYSEHYDHGIVGTPVVAAADATDDVLLGVGSLFGGPRRERRYYYYN